VPTTEQFHAFIKEVKDVYFDWAPVAHVLGWDDMCLSWQMEYHERLALIAVLQNLKPAVAVEIGTYSGGSLAVLSRFSQHVWSLDTLSQSSALLSNRFSNVTYIVGDSKETLPPLLEKLQASHNGPVFIMVDGDHSRSGVRADMNNILKFRPRHPTIVMGHDSFNPDCRAGMVDVSWADNLQVHLVELDYVHGSIFERGNPPHQMWGGLFLALLLPNGRSHELTISRRHELLFRTAMKVSAHRKRPLWRRAGSKLKRIVGSLHSNSSVL
jgi:hypothetical protein